MRASSTCVSPGGRLVVFQESDDSVAVAQEFRESDFQRLDDLFDGDEGDERDVAFAAFDAADVGPGEGAHVSELFQGATFR